MTDRRHPPPSRPDAPPARPEPPAAAATPMHLVIVVGANRLDVTGGSAEVVLELVRLWLEALASGAAVLEEIARATEGIIDNTETLTDAQIADPPPPTDGHPKESRT